MKDSPTEKKCTHALTDTLETVCGASERGEIGVRLATDRDAPERVTCKACIRKIKESARA